MNARARFGAGTDARLKIVLRLKIAFVGQVVYVVLRRFLRQMRGRSEQSRESIPDRALIKRILPGWNAFWSTVKAKRTVVVINLSAADGCPVAKRGGQPEKNKTAGEKRYSDVRPGDAIRPITQMAVSKSKDLCNE